MTSQTDPRKLKALLRDSQAVIPEADEDDEEATGADGADGADEESGDEGDEEEDGDEGEGEELSVESLTESFKPAVATINEIIDEFRQGGDAQPEAGIEQLESELDSELVHSFCKWTDEVGKRDFRKLGEGLELEDVDGFVGWCRAVHKLEIEGDGDESDDEDEESEDDGDEGEGGDEGGEEDAEDDGGEDEGGE
jgi:hypothetical protein